MNARIESFSPGFEDDAVSQLRVPPHSIEAETCVLGGLLLDNSAWDRVGDLLTEGDFYRHEHRLVFGAVGALINAAQVADIFTVYNRLQELGKADEIGGMVYLNSMAQYVPSAGNIRRYAEIVRERAILRKLITASDEIATSAFNTDGKGVATILDEAEQKVFSIGQHEAKGLDDWEDAQSGVAALLRRIELAAEGKALQDYTPTGLAELDARLDGGMRGGELIVIGARPSMGKSALGLTIATHIAMDQRLPVGVFSMEMPKAQVINRLMSLLSHIHLSKIKRPERLRDFDWPGVTGGVEKLRQLPLSISEQTGLNINQIRSRTRALRRRKGKLGTIVVDYLGLMSGTDPKVPRAYQLEEVTKGLKSLAKELDIPVILLVQLNRRVEERIDQMPILSDIRDAGSVEQDADVVVFLHRPIKAKPDLGPEWQYYAKLSVAKVRDGEPGYFDLMYVGENTRFMDWPEGTEKPASQVRTKRGDL